MGVGIFGQCLGKVCQFDKYMELMDSFSKWLLSVLYSNILFYFVLYFVTSIIYLLEPLNSYLWIYFPCFAVTGG